MKNMNDCTSMKERVKMKVAEVASKLLIKQGEQAVKHSIFLVISEAEIPSELLLDESNN